jgi:hypothetical protein
MKKILISALCILLLSACSSTTNISSKSDLKKLEFYNVLFDYQVLVLSQKKYDLYILPSSLLFNNKKEITKIGKNILIKIKDYHDGLKKNKVNIIGHSSNASKYPVEDSKEYSIKTTNYYKSIVKNKNISFTYKGSQIPYYKTKSYNELKKNERVEIIIYK